MISTNSYTDQDDNVSYLSDILSNTGNNKNFKIDMDINEKTISFDQFETSNINFSNIKTNTFGYKIIPIKYNIDELGELEIETPKLRMPFGISNTDKYDTYYVSLSLDNKENKFDELIKKIEKYCIDYIYDHQEILKNGKSKKSKEFIQELFKSKIYQNDNFPPSLRINLNKNTKIKILDKINEEKEININELDLNTTKGCSAKCTILFRGISILGTGYSLSLFVKNIIIYKRKTNKTRIVF
jgi:hypothetical protein